MTAPLPPAAVRSLTAALVLSIGSSIAGDVLWIVGLPLTVLAFLLMWRAAWSLAAAPSARDWKRAVVLWLSAMAGLGIVAPLSHSELWFEIVRRGFGAGGVIAVALFASGHERWRRRAVVTMIFAASLLHLITPFATPHPAIDVFAWTQTATDALLHGVHPYTVQAVDIYGGSRNAGFAVVVYPYMPATLLMFAPWAASFGDYRYGLAVCLPLALFCLRATGRRLRVAPDFVDAVTLALVLHPGGPMFVRSGWTESLMVAAAALFVYLQVRWPDGYLQSIAFWLLPALKQYFVAPVALYLVAMPGLRIKPLLAGAGVSLVTVAPFLIWNWSATMAGIVFQVSAPSAPRLDATSLVSFSAYMWGRHPGLWMTIAVQWLVALVLAVRIRGTGLGALLLSTAVTLTATFLFGWQAFMNYYYLIFVLLLLAAMTLASAGAAGRSLNTTDGKAA